MQAAPDPLQLVIRQVSTCCIVIIVDKNNSRARADFFLSLIGAVVTCTLARRTRAGRARTTAAVSVNQYLFNNLRRDLKTFHSATIPHSVSSYTITGRSS